MKRHFVVVNQYYWPSVAATAQLVTDLCEHLAQAGHRVTVVCSQSVYGEAGTKPALTEERHGVKIRRLPSTSFGRQTNWGRLLNYGSFGLGLLPFLIGLRRVDAFISLSTPPMLASAVLGVSKLKKSKFIYWCQDVYPDVAVALGVIKANGFIEKELNRINRWVLSQAHRVVAVSDGMRELLQQKAICQTVTIPNWSVAPNLGSEQADEIKKGFRQDLNIREGEKVVMYAGNMGRAHDFSALIACWDEPALLQEIHFVIIGDGAKRPELEQAAQNGRQNGWRISFASYVPISDLGPVLSLATLHLLAIDARADRLVFPSKIYGALQSGRPTWLLGAAQSEVGDWINHHQTGTILAAAGEKSLKKQLSRSFETPGWLEAQAANAARVYAEKHDRGQVMEHFREVLEEST